MSPCQIVHHVSPFGFGQECTCSGRVRRVKGMALGTFRNEILPFSPQVGPWRDLEGDRSSIACHFLHSHVSSLDSGGILEVDLMQLDSPWILRCSIAHLKDILPGNNEKHCQHLGLRNDPKHINHQKHQSWGQSSTLLLPRCQGQVLNKNMDR